MLNSDSPQNQGLTDHSEKLQELIRHSLSSGADGAAIISAREIVINEDLAALCKEPRCENYGLSKLCPPHVSGPSALNRQLENYRYAVFFKIDVPSDLLYSSHNRRFFKLLHEIASGIEAFAVDMGFSDAVAFAGGSCKKIFCHEHETCPALSRVAECRYPQSARPSMSGFGIDVSKLFEKAGWTLNWRKQGTDSTTSKIANVCGLVLIDCVLPGFDTQAPSCIRY